MTDKPKRSVSLVDDPGSLSSSTSSRRLGKDSLDRKEKKEKKKDKEGKKKKEKKDDDAKKEKKEKEDKRSKYRSRSLVDLHSSSINADGGKKDSKESKRADSTRKPSIVSPPAGTVATSVPSLSLASSSSTRLRKSTLEDKKEKKKEKKDKEGKKEKKEKEKKGSKLNLKRSSSRSSLVDSGSRLTRNLLSPRGSVDESKPKVATPTSTTPEVPRREDPPAQPKKVATLFLEEFGTAPAKPIKQPDSQPEPTPEPQPQPKGEPAVVEKVETVSEDGAKDAAGPKDEKENGEKKEADVPADQSNEIVQDKVTGEGNNEAYEEKKDEKVSEEVSQSETYDNPVKQPFSAVDTEADARPTPVTEPTDDTPKIASNLPNGEDQRSSDESDDDQEERLESRDPDERPQADEAIHNEKDSAVLAYQTDSTANTTLSNDEHITAESEGGSETIESASASNEASTATDLAGRDGEDEQPSPNAETEGQGTSSTEVDTSESSETESKHTNSSDSEEDSTNNDVASAASEETRTRKRTGTQAFFDSMKEGALKMEAANTGTPSTTASKPIPLPTRSVASLAQALQAPSSSSPQPAKTSPRDDPVTPRRNVLERAKFLQQTEEKPVERKVVSPRAGNVLDRAKFLQHSPESEKEVKPPMDLPRGNVLEKAQFLVKPDNESSAEKPRPEVPRGKVLEKAQFLTTPQPSSTQRRPSSAEELLGAEPKKVNPKTMAIFDNILQQMVRHGGASEPKLSPGESKSKTEDTSTSSRVKAIPVLPTVPAPPTATTESGENAAVETLRSPRRRPSVAPSATPVAPDAVHVVFSDPDATTGVRTVSLGTVPGLINRLTCPDEDPAGFDRDLYILTFLVVHPLFVSSLAVLDHLRQTYVLTGALPSALEEKNKTKGYRSPAVRVIQIITEWADRFPLHFANDKQLLEKFESWVDELKKQKENEKKEKRSKDKATVASKIDMTPLFTATAKMRAFVDNLAAELKEETEAKVEPKDEAAKTGESDDEPFESATVLKELSAKELAQQLTLADFKSFSRISPSEYFHQNWVKHKENAQNLSAMIRWFNEVSMWVMTQIVIGAEVKDRAKTISKFINAAKEMRTLNNYNGIMLLLSALNNSSIRRLTAEWESVGPKAQLALDNLYELLNPDENFGNMRTTLSMCTPPVIPFMGFYLTQVTYIDENDDTRDGMVNFNKMMMLGKVMLELNRYQNATYPFKSLPLVQSYFLDRQPSTKKNPYGRMRWMDEKGVYEKSLLIKPRGS